MIAKMHKIKSWFFEKIKLTNHQTHQKKKGGEDSKINKIRS